MIRKYIALHLIKHNGYKRRIVLGTAENRKYNSLQACKTVTCAPAKHYRRKNIAVIKGRDTLIISLSAVPALFHGKKGAFVMDDGANQYRPEENMLQLEKYLDSALFFRINRNWVINRNFIKYISMDITGKAEILLNLPGKALTVCVSPKRVKRFRRWISEG